ncbi:Hsp70 protein-domain-containing protein [Aspergillus cavernicola]|uniref:Hsp70 protein-domain-containing protein n=1 Tax=Aspergillus cavernicola TaxID=176166 RepID=A0ABR4HVN7_9EURO
MPKPPQRRRTNRNLRISLPFIPFIPLLVFFLLVLPARACPEETRKDSKDKLIGIHLGPEYSRVGVVHNSHLKVLDGHDGRSFMPSRVVATETGLVVGNTATYIDGPNLFHAARHMSGFTIGDPSQAEASGPISYITKDGRQVIQVEVNGTHHTFTPEEIYAPLLTEMRNIAEPRIAGNITGAVVTIPQSFGDTDRECIRNAGRLANLPIIRQVPESNAIIFSLGLDELSYESDRYVVLYDIDDNVDVSVVEIDMGVMDRLATVRRPVIRKVPDEAETLPVYEGEPHALHQQELGGNNDLFELSMAALTTALENAGLQKENITDFIFTKWTGSFPNVQERVAEYFSEARITSSPYLDKAGVWGATLVSGWMQEGALVPCCCWTSHPPIGIRTPDGVVEVISPCQKLPTYNTTSFAASCTDNQTLIQVYMRDIPPLGYHAMFELGDQYVSDTTVDDIVLGEFYLPTPCRANKEALEIEVSVLVTRQSVLQVTAVNKLTKEAGMVTFPNTNFECGNEQRFSARDYTYSSAGMDLELGYWREGKSFVVRGGIRRLWLRRVRFLTVLWLMQFISLSCKIDM